MRNIRESDACLSLKTLKIRGDDLIDMGMKPGKELGAILDGLLELVIDGELPNDAETLKKEARSRMKT